MIDEDKKIERQALFISSKLNIHEPCELKTKYIDSLDKVSIDTLKYILTHNFTKGADMKAVLCLFDTLFLSLLDKKKVKKQDGIYILTEELKTYITKIDVLSSGADATVYNATFFSNIELVIKLGNNEEDESQDEEEKQYKIKQEREMIIREYYIGIKAINKLRYIVPNFVYTLGCFMCDKLYDKLSDSSSDKSMPFIVYEKIPGNTVYDLIVKDRLTFDKWLVIFFQLLLALEVAQREVDFTHFDLHNKNVIIREQKDFNYSVLLDMSTYTINNPTFIPVIIDFGRSNCTVDGQTIGTYGREPLGVLNHMVQGQDMYMFMSHCCNEVKDINLKLQIVSLFSEFYSKDDPYPIKIVENLDKKSGQVKKAIWGGKLKSVTSNFEMVPCTSVGHYTPLMFMQFLLKKYPEELKPYVTVTDRKISQSLQYSIMVKKYNEIFNYNEKGIDKATQLLLSLTKRNSSYVITKYTCLLLEKYNIDLQSDSLLEKIEKVNKFLTKNKEKMIFFDKDMLKKVFDIEIPSQQELDTCVHNILQIKIYLPLEVQIKTVGKGYKFDSEPIKDAIEKLNKVLLYEDKLKIYMQFYFTILELNLDGEFNEWVEQFKKSEIYKFYTQNYLQTERARRWSTTLLISSKNNEEVAR